MFDLLKIIPFRYWLKWVLKAKILSMLFFWKKTCDDCKHLRGICYTSLECHCKLKTTEQHEAIRYPESLACNEFEQKEDLK